jgi:hypothetical protein
MPSRQASIPGVRKARCYRRSGATQARRERGRDGLDIGSTGAAFQIAHDDVEGQLLLASAPHLIETFDSKIGARPAPRTQSLEP